jgi:hypothetical protein
MRGRWVSSGFQERVPFQLEVKLVNDGAYNMDIIITPEDGVLIKIPTPFAFPDTTGHLVEGRMITPHQEETNPCTD